VGWEGDQKPKTKTKDPLVTTTGIWRISCTRGAKNQNQNQTFDNNSKSWRISCVLGERKPKPKPNQTKPLGTTPRAGGISCTRGTKTRTKTRPLATS